MSDLSKLHVVVVGAGPAGLMAADVVSRTGARVTVMDRMPSAGRKFLMAGRGGLNLTHSEPIEPFMSRYRDGSDALRAAIDAFSPADARAWCERLGQETFVGSSGRVFPKAMKTSPLLRAWLRDLAGRSVELRTRTTWQGFDDQGKLLIDAPAGRERIAADAVVLAMGGASWPGLGSDGRWVAPLSESGVAIAPLMPANCGFLVAWSDIFRTRFQGSPLKRIALTFATETVRGEAIVTSHGIEGGAIYALSAPLRNTIIAGRSAVLTIDLRPDLEVWALASALSKRGKASLSTHLRKAAQLDPVAIGLLQEHAHASGVSLASLSPNALASLVKAVPLTLTGLAPIDRAISTAGGVAFDEIDDHFMLIRRPGVFIAGEMLDWDAPTGGYLLQACLATGAAAGRGAAEWLAPKD